MENLVPIFICAIMPISIVLIVFVAKILKGRQQAAVLLKAIEVNPGIDADRLAEALKRPRRTPLQILNLRLLRGCIFSLIGIGLVICAFLIDDPSAGEDNPFVPALFFGVLSASIGISYLIVYAVTRKQLPVSADEQESTANR